MPGNAIFMSIRPQYANKIFDGIKTVELRRVRPKYIARKALILVYVSSPVKSLVGAFKVDRIIKKPLSELWEIVRDRAGVTREEFDAYFDGTLTGVGIFFSETWRLPEPIALRDLEDMIGFQPPQGFRYATASELAAPQLATLLGNTEAVVQGSFLGREN